MARINYASSLSGSRSAVIEIEGQTYTLKRLRFGGFIQLKNFEAQFSHNAEACLKYVKLGAPGIPYTGRTLFYIIMAIAQVNYFPDTLAFLEPTSTKTEKKPEPPAWNYPARGLNHWVHLIAKTYHWSRDEIFNLWPDEAMCYIQEILVDEYKDKEWEWELAGFGWKTDKSGISTKNPFPAPDWAKMASTMEIPRTNLRVDMLPVGSVINISGV